MKILVACEESQAVCAELRKLGHEAYSCDTQEQLGGHPEWHIQADALPLLNGDCEFETNDGVNRKVDGKWDMIIAFPPCTYLTFAANRHHSVKCRTLEQISERTQKRIEAEKFFMAFVNADCERIAIENPLGVMSTVYRAPDQIIHPYYFGDPEMKRTCLWLKNLPTLEYKDTIIDKPEPKYYLPNGKRVNFTDAVSKDRARVRSKTFQGIAKAMARQWAGDKRNE